ncbi:hypothetical protein M0R45_002636 [Rubus argutus]|uniref:Uncharacterized protein n=1 Tax=Rubus argutus TaxID=59490 RepID=A0AAW1VNI1_RUBAR
MAGSMARRRWRDGDWELRARLGFVISGQREINLAACSSQWLQQWSTRQQRGLKEDGQGSAVLGELLPVWSGREDSSCGGRAAGGFRQHGQEAATALMETAMVAHGGGD